MLHEWYSLLHMYTSATKRRDRVLLLLLLLLTNRPADVGAPVFDEAPCRLCVIEKCPPRRSAVELERWRVPAHPQRMLRAG